MPMIVTLGVIALFFVFLPLALAMILSVVAVILTAYCYPIVYPGRKDVLQASRSGAGKSVVVVLFVLTVVSVFIFAWMSGR